MNTDPGVKWFALLVGVQAAHSLEEWFFELWAVYPPAKFLSGLFGPDLPLNFAVLNGCFVAAMLVSLIRFHRLGRLSVPLASGWILVELINGSNHLLQAYAVGGYFPGVCTAPFLLLFSVWLAVRVYRESRSAPA